MTLRSRVEQLLAPADVAVDGARPWDIQVHEEAFFARLLAEGSLGVGESYMDAWWDCEQLDELFYRVLRADLDRTAATWHNALWVLKAKLFNFQRPRRAFHIGRHHYDLGNELFQAMLDRRMIYSCAYWKDAPTLDEAQEAKLHLVCRKLGLEPGMRVLDIGCGWGGTAKFAAEEYGVSVLGITVSEQQARHARALCEGLDVEIRFQDYRSLDGTFDRVLSLGMFEHVGYKNYDTFMRIVRDRLTASGLFLLQSIGSTRTLRKSDLWTERYIFPNSMLPSARQISDAIEDRFVLEDWHSFGPDYDRTLMHWYRNFEEHWPELQERYGQRFYRMWKYFLLSSAGSFRARKNQLWQILLSPRGLVGSASVPR